MLRIRHNCLALGSGFVLRDAGVSFQDLRLRESSGINIAVPLPAHMLVLNGIYGIEFRFLKINSSLGLSNDKKNDIL